jgi:hypothetical protein
MLILYIIVFIVLYVCMSNNIVRIANCGSTLNTASVISVNYFVLYEQIVQTMSKTSRYSITRASTIDTLNLM